MSKAAKKSERKKVSPKLREELKNVRAAVDQATASAAPPAAPESMREDFTPAAPGIEKISLDVAPAASAQQPKRGPGRPRKDAAAVASPAATAAPPLSDQPDLPDVLLTEQQCEYLLQLVGSFATMGVAMTTKLPVEKVGEIWKFSDRELHQISPAATKVANKHLPWWFKQYADEIGLLIVVLPVLTAKMSMTIALRAQLAAEKKPDPAPPAKPNGSGIHPVEAHA